MTIYCKKIEETFKTHASSTQEFHDLINGLEYFHWCTCGSYCRISEAVDERMYAKSIKGYLASGWKIPSVDPSQRI